MVEFQMGVAQVQRANMQRAFLAHHENVFNELYAFFNPPPPPPEPETEIVYVPEDEQGIGRLGYRDFNAKLFGGSALRWW